MWASNKADGFTAVKTTHNGSDLTRETWEHLCERLNDHILLFNGILV